MTRATKKVRFCFSEVLRLRSLRPLPKNYLECNIAVPDEKSHDLRYLTRIVQNNGQFPTNIQYGAPFSAGLQFSAVPLSAGLEFHAVSFSAGIQFTAVKAACHDFVLHCTAPLMLARDVSRPTLVRVTHC